MHWPSRCPATTWPPAWRSRGRRAPDGLVYEFKLREGLRFHNGDPFTAEDVKFSFERYRGNAAKILHERVKAVEVVDAHRVRFALHTPWPGYGQPRDWEGDGRVQRKDDDFPTPSAVHMSRGPRAGIIQRPAVRLAQAGPFA
jgi:hypothetical protein